ncbi:IS66 family insertion sequence element accessory protein TnpA [Shewanella surugensis]|uniref:Transposase n=1 Tax=Shewanella surugensis TaxID=212020 RepID=A0ABT0LJ48_9GAMM|nr:transposase [Shewanella surugensis]MCL1127732.1 transposase [Shewanella surugensis]
MTKRSHEEWIELIAQQSESGLTIGDFCRQHKVSTSTFYARKANKPKQQAGSPFVQASLAASSETAPQHSICLQHQTGLWTFPCALPASYLLEIIAGLQKC